MPLAARSVTRRTFDFLAANLAALIFRAAESESIDSRLVHIHHIVRKMAKIEKQDVNNAAQGDPEGLGMD